MSKFNPGNLLWIGSPPVPPEPPPYLLGWNPALRKFKPYGLPVKTLTRCSSASADFVAQIKTMTEKIPAGIVATLNNFGVAILPGGTVFEAPGWLDWNGPRGHDGRFAWKTISGLCMYEGHLLLIGQYYENDRGYLATTNLQGIFNHELGHCFDAALRYISRSPEFLACVAADCEKLSPLDKAIYRYLLQPGDAGPSELFAECFACTQGLCCVESWTKDMPTYFSSTYQFVKDLVTRFSSTNSHQEITNAL